MIGLCLFAYVVAIGQPTGEVARDSFLKEGVRPCDFERLTPKAKSGKSHLDSFGTGFFITADGHLLTNHHVVKDADEIVIVQHDRAYRADVASCNEKKDLALLKVNLFPRATNGVMVVNGLPQVAFLPFASGISVGQTVYVVGFPEPELLGYEPKVTRGMVNSMTGLKGRKDIFQIDALVTHGNSGGPAVDEYGAVAGVVSSGTDKSIGNYNYAIKGDAVRSFLPRNVVVETAAQRRRLDAVRLAKRIVDASVLVLVYKSGACEKVEATVVSENDVNRREEATRRQKAVLDARLCKLRKDWQGLKDITDWMLSRYGDIDDAKPLNDLARDELGLHIRITAEADGRDVAAVIRPLRGFRGDHVVCGTPAALYGGDVKRGFVVEAKLEYEDAEWMWAGELKCPYDWTGTKEVRITLKHVGKK